MFQSRITAHQRQEYVRLLETDPEKARVYKLQFDRTDQWFLEELKESLESESKSPKVPWTTDDVELQMETDLAHGKYKNAAK